MNVTYPLLVKEFHQHLATVQWITTAYLLTVTIVMGTTAYLLKQVPARRLHLGAALAFICGCIICAVTTSLIGGQVYIHYQVSGQKEKFDAPSLLLLGLALLAIWQNFRLQVQRNKEN